MKSTHINTVEAKNNFNKIVAKVRASKSAVVVDIRGEPAAVILDYETYKQLSASNEKNFDKSSGTMDQLRNFHKLMQKKYPQGTGDAAALLSEARSERLR